MFAVKEHYSGRFHTEVEGTNDEIMAQGLEPLQTNHRFVSVSWAGGWDEYIIDLSDIKQMSIDEIEYVEKQRKGGGGVFPTNNNRLLSLFIKKIQLPENSTVKIVRHLCGGD